VRVAGLEESPVDFNNKACSLVVVADCMAIFGKALPVEPRRVPAGGAQFDVTRNLGVFGEAAAGAGAGFLTDVVFILFVDGFKVAVEEASFVLSPCFW